MSRLLLIVVGLGGCTLIDQRTFNPEAGRRPTVPVPVVVAANPADVGPKALLAIRLPVEQAALRADIAKSVGAARRAKPTVEFDVVEFTQGAAGTMGDEAVEVARMIIARGVPPARVHLGVRPSPSPAREVRVYVR